MPCILIIDDDPSLRDSLRRILRSESYTIVEAGEGGEGIKVLKSQQVDLVLVDLFMPGKEGLETISELRRSHPSVPVLAMSGGGSRGMIDVLRIAKAFGARRTLVKPFTREQLLEAVQEELR